MIHRDIILQEKLDELRSKTIDESILEFKTSGKFTYNGTKLHVQIMSLVDLTKYDILINVMLSGDKHSINTDVLETNGIPLLDLLHDIRLKIKVRKNRKLGAKIRLLEKDLAECLKDMESKKLDVN